MKIRSLHLLCCLSIQIILLGQRVEVNQEYEKGLLVDGFKEGVWEYYEDKELKLKVDYTTGELLYLAKDTSDYAIETENGWKFEKLDIYPHYIGSIEEINNILEQTIRYPLEAINNSITGTVLLGFEIDINGKANNIKTLTDIGCGCGEEALRIFDLIPNYWLTATKNENNYKSRYILPVSFQIGEKNRKGEVWKKETETNTKNLNEAKESFYPTNYLDEVVVSLIYN